MLEAMSTKRREGFHTSDGWRELSGDGAHPGEEIPHDPVHQPPAEAPPVGGLVGRLWRLGQRAREDVEAALVNDPAARSRLEVALTYPGVHALWMHRLAHGLWRRERTLGARTLSHLSRFLTGVEIHPGAQLGRGVFIDHGMGIVIGETAQVGDGTLLYKGVVLGGTSLERTLRHPQIGRNVVVGSNACVLGGVEIGDNAKIGSGSVVVRDVPAGATVVGVPGRVILDRSGQRVQPLADHAHADLPDPIANALASLNQRVAELEVQLAEAQRCLAEEAARGKRAPAPEKTRAPKKTPKKVAKARH